MRGDPFSKVGKGPDRGAQHDAVGAFHRGAWIKLDAVREAEFHHPVQCRLGAGVDDDLGGDVAALPCDARDRGPDQPDAQKREALEKRISHGLAD
jgi:hypothetical protein